MMQYLQQSNLKCRNLKWFDSFIKLGSSGLKAGRFVSYSMEKDGLKVDNLKFSYRQLRDHCRCSDCYNHPTHQRIFSPHQLPRSLMPTNVTKVGQSELQIEWPDNHSSRYSIDFLKKMTNQSIDKIDFVQDYLHHNQCFWDRNLIKSLEHLKDEGFNFDFQSFVNDPNVTFNGLLAFLKYGFIQIANCPIEDKSIQLVADSIGPMRSTLFSTGLWDFTSNIQEHQDMAYGTQAIPAHNDGTYYDSTPYIQSFFCYFNEGDGGETVLVDGFKAATNLYQNSPSSFKFLCDTKFLCRYKEPNYYLHSFDTMIQIDHSYKSRDKSNGYPFMFEKIRFNNEDRSILNSMSCLEQVEQFYDAFSDMTREVRNPDLELKFMLKPGNLILVNNWRVFHARTQVNANRKIGGFYMDRDYVHSRVRHLAGNSDKNNYYL